MRSPQDVEESSDPGPTPTPGRAQGRGPSPEGGASSAIVISQREH
jgi:hypothetical protein